MDLNKMINNIQDFQLKIDEYEIKNKKINDVISNLKTELHKIEKKIENEHNEIEKHFLFIKKYMIKDFIGRFNFLESGDK